MACKIPTGEGEDPWEHSPDLPRRCVAPWHDEEARRCAERVCADGCRAAGCVPGVAPTRWAATAWDRGLRHEEVGALLRCAIGGWSEEDARIVGGLCRECRRAGRAMDAETPEEHTTWGALAAKCAAAGCAVTEGSADGCPGWCTLAIAGSGRRVMSPWAGSTRPTSP